MTKEALDFLGLHGELLVDRLKRDILAALESEDDARALDLDGLLKKIEEISKVEGLRHSWVLFKAWFHEMMQAE